MSWGSIASYGVVSKATSVSKVKIVIVDVNREATLPKQQ